ncbi:MAG TPA: hypothetical protein VGP63_01060 [Planctomycetaceae bacterium]|jgi:uncharacterized repeat protein (TIGR01451 family)|nr:hypothetical protein [Planctomycetaceae bacterium]
MKGLVWKIALVTAVLAVGFLVLLQAQRGMSQALLKKTAGAEAAASTDAPPAPTATSDPGAAASSTSKADPFGDAGPGNVSHFDEPKANETKNGPTVVAPVAAKEPDKSSVKTAAAADPKEAAAGDPFSDSDAKHSTRAVASKSAASNGLEVKQTSGSSDANGKSPNPVDPLPTQATPMPDAPGPKLPGAAPTGLNDPKPLGLKSNEAKSNGPNADLPKSDEAGAAPRLSEPSTALQSEPSVGPKPAEQKPTEQKPSDGPQLPGFGPALDLPPAGSSAPQAETKAASNPPSLSGSGDGMKPPAAAPDPTDKPTPKATAPDPMSDASSGGPKPFPDEGPKKEVPLPAPALPAPTAGPSNPASSGPPVFDLTPASASPSSAGPPTSPPHLPETKSADAGNSALPASRSSAESHSEAAPDFQGDGTVGDAAPLGPQRPQLNIEKIAPSNALLGQPLIYAIVVKNVGQSAARDVVVEDRIPKGTKLSGTIPRAELTGKKLIWRIGTLGAGEQRKISIRVIPQEAGEIGSVATVNFVAEAAAETVVTAPRLEFKISAPSTARLGEMVPFRFEVRNVGTGEARGVMIRDLIPQGLSHSSGSDLEYEVGRLLPGKSKQLTLDLKAGKVGTAVNRAVVLAEGGLTTEAKAAIEISGSKVALSRSGPQRRYLGRQALFTNTLVNESSFPVDGVVLVESIPTGMEFAGATQGGQYNDGSRTIAWRIDQMAPGETRVVKSRLVARGLGSQTSTVRVTVPNGEPVERTSKTDVEGFAALGLDLTGADGPIDLGEKITLHVNARNKGTVPVSNLMVTVEVPDQLEVVSARGPGKPVQEPGRLKFGPVATLEGRTAAACEIVLAARKRGDSRVRVSIQADQIDKPLAREESILILSETPEPTAAR